MAYKFRHKYTEFSDEAIRNRVKRMVEIREKHMENVEKLHVYFSFGNRKTGVLVPSVSLIPIADCPNCSLCKNGCYDIRNVCFQKVVMNTRAINSAICHSDMDRFFEEIRLQAYGQRFLRYNVGGEILNGKYFQKMVDVAKATPTCEFLAFTKMYEMVNEWLDNNVLPVNLHIIFSDWKGAKFDNRHNMPVSSPVWYDENGNEIERGHNTTDKCFMCPGDCSECAITQSGCWTLQKGETVLFEAH